MIRQTEIDFDTPSIAGGLQLFLLPHARHDKMAVGGKSLALHNLQFAYLAAPVCIDSYALNNTDSLSCIRLRMY